MRTSAGNCNRFGFTVVEMLISLVMLSFFTLTALTFIDSIRNESLKTEKVTYRNNEAAQFFMQMTQPTYVGALADYPENSELLKCLSPDGALCDINKNYFLTAYDLVTGKPVKHLDMGSEGYVNTSLSFKVHCPLEKTSCDQADYINITIQTSVLGKLGLSLMNEKVVTVEPKRTNVLTFIPNTEIKTGSPANIVIFIDGSNSMSAIKASFKTTLAKFFDSIKSMDVTVGIYALSDHMTQMPGAGAYTLDASGVKTYIGNPNLAPGGTIMYSDGDLRLNYTKNYSVFKFAHDMTDPVRATTLASVNTAVDKIFATSNGDKDAPLCGILRGLQDFADGKSGLDITAGAPTMFMILTNEDDDSILANAGESLNTAKYQPLNYSIACAKTLTYKSQKDYGYRFYSGQSYYYQVSGTADYVIDGVASTKVFSNYQLLEKLDASYPKDADCTAPLKASHLPEINRSLVNSTGPYASYPGATFTGNYTITGCKVLYVQGSLGISEPDVNRCETYFNTDPYTVPGSCKYEDVPSTQTGVAGLGQTVKEAYVPADTKAHSTGDITQAIYDVLKDSLNIANFTFVAVINPSTGVCPLSAGAAYGTKYEKLAKYPGLASEIIPICSSSYDTELLNTSNYLKSFGLGNITLPANIGARVTGVDVLRGSTVLNPTAGKDYTVQNDLLTFSPGYLQTTDIVRVYLK